ncbi:DUF3039 domain-containing protein [Leucobacter chromiiresistens]|uniref:Uncharacterized protein n=1 Tax=Leucobacter chromiiresistens TaxID=1079994 RepID=A0A1H1BCH6_9MICO|nr:DUF3039 domain-containing protein [Leucobacter chromiiresistens]SDQ49570.1 Protein of unknown function [Leucobacter chromiiresistens]
MTDFNHYVRRTDITRSIVMGGTAKALCGETLQPKHQGAKAIPNQEVAHVEFETCPDCELFYQALASEAKAKEPTHA